jgi:long-chain acyl-CoA synthetase
MQCPIRRRAMISSYDEPLINGFERACEKYPDHTALIYIGEKISYKKLKELIDRFATALHNLGVKQHDKVMLYLPNCPQFLIGYFGAQKIGAVPVPVSPIYTPNEISYLINDSGAETVLCQDTNFRYIEEVFPSTCLKRAIVTNLIDLLPFYKRTVSVMYDLVPNGVVHWKDNIYSFRKVIRSNSPNPPKVNINPRHDLCYILYTGGTTGFPKGCLSTHSGMVSFVEEVRDLWKDHISDGHEVFVMVNSLFHQLAQGVILGAVLTKGNAAILVPIPQVDAILEDIERTKASLFLGAPMLYRMILENDRLDYYDLSSLKYCWSGGDVLPSEMYNRWLAKFKIPIRQVYGSTEVGFVAVSPLDRDPVQGSLGFPLPSRQVRVVDPDTMEDVPQGTTGELIVTSEYIPKGYWNNPEETAKAYVELDGQVWYRMNDFVRMGEDGQLYYIDRSADVIKCKGFRVSCSEIEAVLQDHPAVIGACVIGVPDRKVGERIKAFVVLKPDARGVGGNELTKFCRDRLAAYKIPGYIEFRDMLPKSKVGKLLRREIRDEERRRISKGEKTVKV